MREKWKKFVASKGLQKWFRKENLIVVVLLGVLLLVVAWPLDRTSSDSNPTTNVPSGQGTSENGLLSNTQNTRNDSSYPDTQTYKAYLEEQLEETLRKMDGIGEVVVMITLQSSEELVVDKDSDRSTSNTTETDSSGGQRNLSSEELGSNTVLYAQDNQTSPFVVKTNTPKVEGVLILAQGAGKASVNADIIEAADVLFGVGAHKIKVLKMEDEK
ncbi:MAG: hypothetical protein LBM69_09070 [Lachnospiraceae bacterium]|nr:hypothetical protein [Lachnospiraceae bacterium]